MSNIEKTTKKIESVEDFQRYADYSYINRLNPDPDAREDGVEHTPREVFSGHYVLVNPTPIANPRYIAHSKELFSELGISDVLATSSDFMRLFSADSSVLPDTMQKRGWATGYALSIYGTEYYEQCPFGRGNDYGDGRAMSILELLIDNKRWEMQLKGGGKTPYCRGADGRAVLRSSVREFLAQEHMHALGIPTSRSLTLYTSESEVVRRPWFRNGSYSKNPEVMIEEAVAISTRVAPSFLRVGQIELYARRARKNEHPNAKKELEMIVLHLIEREYSDVIDADAPLQKKVVALASEFRERLTKLVAEWIRVGYCQGNFNSDNCAAGGFTLDYGPFGFIDEFDPRYQPWTGGGAHFSFLNQPQAAQQNFDMFYTSLLPLLQEYPQELKELGEIRDDFEEIMERKIREMWCTKLGLEHFDAVLLNKLMALMVETSVDYTLFFRELSSLRDDISGVAKSFYGDAIFDEKLQKRWSEWYAKYLSLLNITDEDSKERLSAKMKQVNPKYTLREWFLVPAYQAAQKGDYGLIHELQEVMSHPYDEQSKEIEQKYYKEKPLELFRVAGVSHMSCSS